MSERKFITARHIDSKKNTSSDYFVGTSLHLRASEQRKSSLESYLFVQTGEENIHVELDEDAETASIQNYTNNDQPVIVTIPIKDIENPFDDINEETFYSILQYAWALHEQGHYKYTDQPTVKEEWEALKKKLKTPTTYSPGFVGKLLNDIWNAIEDGAIEELIRLNNGPRAGQRLAIKNETFLAQSLDDYPKRFRQNVTFDFALHLASIDLAKYDTGGLRRLLDEDDPTWEFKNKRHEDLFFAAYSDLRNTIAEALTTVDAERRTRLIFDLLQELLKRIENDFEEKAPKENPNRESLRQGQKNDLENNPGKAQQQQNSSNLNQNSKQEIAQRHANISQQPVSLDPNHSSDEEAEQEHPEEENKNLSSRNTENNQPQPTHPENSTASNQNRPAETEKPQNNASKSDHPASNQKHQSPTPENDTPSSAQKPTGPEHLICPKCGSKNTEKQTQEADATVAARANPPFDIHAEWVRSITFVSDDEICGFRIKTEGPVPKAKIENNGYKVVKFSSEVEILEPRDRYDSTEFVEGHQCQNCDHLWIPIIGGDNK